MSTVDGMWLAAAIMGLPTAAVLAVTGYRHYGWARSFAVAVTIALMTCVISWMVVLLGLLALTILPGRSAADRQFEHVSGG
jgi:hypothetical protein